MAATTDGSGGGGEERAAGEGAPVRRVAGGSQISGGRGRRRFHLPTVLLWLVLGTLIALTSTCALRLGIEALYLVVTGWIIGPFFLYWALLKIRGMWRK